MPFLETIRRAFVSYSRQDHKFVDTLASELRKSTFELWVDFQGLQPGTPDWESAVREAIEESFAFLLIASPDSRRSPYVRSELLLAQARELPIYALWAAGESWIDSIPMSLAHIQYLDFRDRAYADGLHTLIGELSGFGAAIPKHFIYKSFYKRFAYNEVRQGLSRPKV
jgi:TIR domain